jgi:hypothetical protein
MLERRRTPQQITRAVLWIKRRERPILWTAFLFGGCAAFWGSFEAFTTLTELGVIASPVWSGTFGYPYPHHYIWGTALAGASIAALEFGRWKSDRAKKGRIEEPHREG